MITDLPTIQKTLQDALSTHTSQLQIRVQSETNFEVAGTKIVMQGKKKVDGHYFASVIPKVKDIRLYFFPLYTHAVDFELSPDLQKFLKGKTCFHIKKLSEDLIEEINAMVAKGVNLYEKDGLI